MYLCEYIPHEFRCQWRPEGAIGSFEAVDAGFCETPNVVQRTKLMSSGKAGSALNHWVIPMGFVFKDQPIYYVKNSLWLSPAYIFCTSILLQLFSFNLSHVRNTCMQEVWTLTQTGQWYQISRMGLFILLKVKNYRTLYIRMSRHLVYLPASHQS